MLDTLKLSLQDYDITPGADLVVQPATINYASGETSGSFILWNEGHKRIEGSKAFHNSKYVNVNLKPVQDATGSTTLCLVQFSVPKVVEDDNYNTVDYKGTKEALWAVENYLKQIGIRTDIKTANLSRVDACKTLRTDEAYQCYHPVLQQMQGKRLHKRDYGTTFLWSNTQQELTFYDKIEEMLHRKMDVSAFHRNSVRAEYRMLKAKKVRDVTGLKTVNDLLAGYEQIERAYVHTMRDQLFKAEPSEIQLMTVEGIAREMQMFMDRGDRYWFRSWMRAVALQRGVKDFDAAMHAVSLVAPYRATAQRLRNELKEARLDAEALKIVAPSQRCIGDLYAELKQKVLAN